MLFVGPATASFGSHWQCDAAGIRYVPARFGHCRDRGPSTMRQANGGGALANELTVKAASKCDEVETTARTGISLRDEARHS